LVGGVGEGEVVGERSWVEVEVARGVAGGRGGGKGCPV